jgi:uncharacterized protein (TIGR03435 family)
MRIHTTAVGFAIALSTSLPSAQERPAFEAATVKLAAPGAVPRSQIVPTSPNRLYIPSMTLSWLIYTAYGDGGLNTSMRVTGGPEWVNSTSYAIEGVASGTPGPREFRRMLQVLLEERFALKLRTEVRTAEMNTIVVDGKLGPNVKPWDGTCRSGKPSVEDEPTGRDASAATSRDVCFLTGQRCFRSQSTCRCQRPERWWATSPATGPD